MNTRACCIALIVGACIASPSGSGETSSADRINDSRSDPVLVAPGVIFAAEDVVADVAAMANGRYGDPQTDFRVHLLEPALRDAQHGSRNPAGRLVLPGPQTSHAPAF